MKGGSDGDGSGRQVSRFVPGWRPTTSLGALEDLMDAMGTAPVAAAQRVDLTVTELHALRHLSRRPLTIGELARLLRLSSAGASGIIERLSERGLVARERHPSDGRKSRIVITELGHEVGIGALVPLFTTLSLLDSTLSDEERQLVTRFLHGATAAFRSLQ